MKRAAALLLLGSLTCFAQEQRIERSPAPVYPAAAHSYLLPYAHEENFQDLKNLHVRASINGGPVESFVVDTGSAGIVVEAKDVHNIDPNGRRDTVLYTSSGVEHEGIRTMVTVRFPDAVDEEGKRHPVEARVEVLAVTKTRCLHMGPNAGHCHASDHPHVHMMGVGFGRGPQPAEQHVNAFTSLKGMLDGKMHAGYIFEPDGIHLGLNEANAGSGFIFQKLQPRDGIPDAGPKDWQVAPGSFSVGSYQAPPGVVLIDTGLDDMIIEAPGQKEHGAVHNGTPMTIDMPAGLHYSFKVGESGATTPREVTWAEPKHGVYVNTGVRALAAFDYLYDADDGYVALRPRK